MEKFIIIAGSSNCGKTESANLVSKKLISIGFIIEPTLNNEISNFWEEKDINGNWIDGVVILKREQQKIGIINFGDVEDKLLQSIDAFKHKCQIVICCSRATRGKSVFDALHKYINDNIDLTKTKVIPIYKNFLCYYGNSNLENESTADLIIELL